MKWGKIKAIIVRDLKLIFREKSTLFWLFIFPLILLSGYVALFAPRGPAGNTGTVVINVAVVPESVNASTLKEIEELVKHLENPWNTSETMKIEINATVQHDLDQALKRLKKGYLDAIILIPENFFSEQGLNITIYVLRGTPDHVKEQLVVSYLYAFFSQAAQFSAMGILSGFINQTASQYPQLKPYAEDIVTRAWNMVTSPNINLVNVTPGKEQADIRSRDIGWMTLSVIFMNFMFGGILGGSNVITSEIRRGFIHRLLSTRLKPSEYFSGLALSWIVVLTITTLPIYFLGFVVYGGTLAISPFSTDALFTLLLILVTELLTFSLGILIGMLARSPEGASLIANLVIWATMIGGGFWIPKFMLPSFYKAFADVNIISILFYAVTEIAVYGRGITGYLVPTVVAVVISVVLFVVASIVYVKYLPKLLEKAEVS